MNTYLTVREAADLLRVSQGTIRNWIKDDILKAYQLNPSGRILIKVSDIDDALEKGRII